MSLKSKIISVASAAALAVTGLTGLGASATDTTLITNGGPYTGNATYIGTYFKSDYFGNSAFEISYKYTKLAENTTITEDDGTTRPIDYTDTFEFLVFDQDWGGWEKTKVGQAEVELNKVYTETVPISTIEAALTTGKAVQGINLQTGGINDAQVEITSLKYVSGTVAGQEVTITGEWTKGTGGTMTVSSAGGAAVSTNEWNIQVSQFSVNGFANPRVDVTVEYNTNPNDYVQAELQRMSGSPIVPNYPMVNKTGEVVYTTEIPESLTAFLACYDACTVKEIHIYDYTAGNVSKSVSNKNATEVASDMGMAWNLGNSFDSVDSEGNVSETIWGNPITTKELFIAVKNAGFNTIRIPVSYLNMIKEDNSVNDEYLERLQVIIDDAYNMGMYVVIDMHNDGGYGVTGNWLDITSSNFDTVKNKFAAVWSSIATYFADYDQKLVFEGFNELLAYSHSYVPTDTEYDRINDLNQAFVTSVRAAGGNNTDRVLIVAGYNTNINYTIAGFVAPEDSAANRLMLSVHYYDPYNFALNENGTSSWSNNADGSEMKDTIDRICKFAADENMPLFIGEYGPIDKNNTSDRAAYCYWLNKYAVSNPNNVKVVLAYWDNGVVGLKGSALFDRTTDTITAVGATIVNFIAAGYSNASIPSV